MCKGLFPTYHEVYASKSFSQFSTIGALLECLARARAVNSDFDTVEELDDVSGIDYIQLYVRESLHALTRALKVLLARIPCKLMLMRWSLFKSSWTRSMPLFIPTPSKKVSQYLASCTIA